MDAFQAVNRIKASKDVLLVVLAIISSLSVALTDLSGMSGMLFKHTLAVLFVFWIVSAFWTLPRSTAKGKRPAAKGNSLGRRYLATLLVTLVYALTASWFTWETKFRHVDGIVKPFDPYAQLKEIQGGWIISEGKAEESSSALKIEQFFLLKDQTTFIESKNDDLSKGAKDGARIERSFAMTPKWFGRGKSGCMDGMYDRFPDALDGDIATMDAFTYYLEKSKKDRLYPYLENIIINKARRPDIEKQLYPSSAELEAMRQDTSQPDGRKALTTCSR